MYINIEETANHTYSDSKHTWKVATLWKAAKKLKKQLLPIEDVIDIKEFLDSYSWSAGKMTVKEILSHSTRIDEADLNYPIILTPEGCIADGTHRIIKALKIGHQKVVVVRLDKMPEPIS